MKTKHLILGAAILTMSAALSLTSCRKDNSADSDTSGAGDNTLAEQSFNDMNQASDEASTGSVSSYRMYNDNNIMSNCATVSIVKNADSSGSITIDFGSSNCLCHDSKWRRGKIFVTYTTGVHHLGYWDSTCAITISTHDPVTGVSTYYVGPDQNMMHQVIGTRNVINNGRNAAHHMNWSVNESGQIIKANNQGTITWNSTRNRELLSLLPAKYSITGTSSGTLANGNAFTETITSPIIIDMSCIYRFVSGTFDYTPGAKPTRHVDFSPPNNGGCDNTATVVINNKTYTIQF